jgi:hypothetical protein
MRFADRSQWREAAMSEGAGNHSGRSFRIEVALTDGDIVAYQQIVLAKRRAHASRFRWVWPGAIFGLPLLVGWLMVQGEIVHANDEGSVSVILFAVVLLPMVMGWALSGRRTRQELEEDLNHTRARFKDGSIRVCPNGIVVRTTGGCSFLRSSAVKGVTVARGLLVLWAAPEVARAIAFVPIRLLQPDQRELLLSLGHRSIGP